MSHIGMHDSSAERPSVSAIGVTTRTEGTRVRDGNAGHSAQSVVRGELQA